VKSTQIKWSRNNTICASVFRPYCSSLFNTGKLF